jgi:hypothetical protein
VQDTPVLLGILALVAALIGVPIAFVFIRQHVALRRRGREELAHLESVAAATGGEVDARSVWGQRVLLDARGFRGSYAQIAYSPGFDGYWALVVDAEWIAPTFGVWRIGWVKPWKDAQLTPYAGFQDLRPIAACAPPDGWAVLGEREHLARELWERLRAPFGELLPHLDALKATPDSTLIFFFRDDGSSRPPPAVVRAVADLVPLLRDCLRAPPKPSRAPFRD